MKYKTFVNIASNISHIILLSLFSQLINYKYFILQFCRWSFLLTGIAYGAYHQRRLSKRENARREEELKLKPIRDAKLAEEKKLAAIGKKII